MSNVRVRRGAKRNYRGGEIPQRGTSFRASSVGGKRRRKRKEKGVFERGLKEKKKRGDRGRSRGL